MKISREVKTGILVLLGIILFVYGFNYLKGENLFSSEDVYYTEFDYNALSTSSPVTIRGNAVGKIKEINYDFETGKTVVAFTVASRLKFSKNSTIRLYETGLMGGNALAIIKGKDSELAQSGDIIKSEVQPGLITSLTKNFSGISGNLDSKLQSADTLMVNLNKLVVDESDAGLKQTIEELNSTLKSFKSLSYSFQGLVKKNDENISGVLENFNKVSENLTKISDDLKTVEFSKTIAKLDGTLASLNNVLSGIENGEGSMGKLLKNDQLYNNIEGATKEMEALLKDIKLHPKRYFRILSKKEIPYSEEETD